jgi:hypothetical protein
MGVTSIRVSQRDQFLGQIDRLAGSHALHSSESLCKLLRYLARQALEHPAEPLKEYQIATEVFGRPADFDPQLDSTIRVQAGRLRTKLAEYYASEGTDDPIVVELPKGTYHLAFHHRAAAAKAHSSNGIDFAAERVEVQSAPTVWRIASVTLAVLLAAALASIFVLVATRKPAGVASASQGDKCLRRFEFFGRLFCRGPMNRG